VELDVTSPEGWESADRIAEEEFGGLHGLSDWVLA
jgi:hypothetical protein